MANDVLGLGYDNPGGPETFDKSAEFGGAELAGIVWMPSNWTDPEVPSDVFLPILAEETAHRWGVTVFYQPTLGEPSSRFFSDWDLHLMGLLPAADVKPMTLLVNVIDEEVARNAPPEALEADVETITIEQVVSAEGPRIPNASASAKTFKQAFLYVVPEGDVAEAAELERLDELRLRWEGYFTTTTRGFGSVTTALD
ncbi:MAG: hypothetical protein JNL83_32695 [Myxococcales bacterium]|nr:hypothetical protein [Myxococcales bacterium]